MIESGSLTPGVTPDAFGLPPSTAVRIELPAAPLRTLLTDYHVLDSDPAIHHGATQAMLPSWPIIRFVLTDQPIRLSLGQRHYDPVPRAALYGTSTRAMRMVTHGGVTVGVGISPLGWSRFFNEPASRFRDQLVPLDRLMPAAEIADLYSALRASNLSGGVKPILDRFFGARQGSPKRDEPRVAAFMRLLRNEEEMEVPAIAEHLGISQVALRRLSVRHFGFPPKLLLMRARFLRSIVRMLLAGPTPDYSLMSHSYFDVPHFLRDAERFLGMTPRRFFEHDNSYLIATLRARRAVFAAARPDLARATAAPAAMPMRATAPH